MDRFSKICFFFAIALAGFIYGVATVHYQIFPYELLREAKRAATSLTAGQSSSKDSGTDTLPAHESETTVRNYAGVDDGALILVCGGEGYLDEHNPGDGCVAWLMDRQGNVKHVWKYDPDVWDDLQIVKTVPGKSQIIPRCVEVFEDGSLLVSYQGMGMWPYGVGLAKFDRDSKLLWNKELLAHHWFTITKEGNIITPAVRIAKSPYPIGKTSGEIRNKEEEILEDLILVLDPNGNVLEEISMLEVVHDSGLIGLYQGAKAGETDMGIDTWDPLHLNSVELADAKTAASHDWLNEGDMLLSFRDINTVAILNPKTRRLVWSAPGTTLRQHSPRFYQGGVLVLDNLGGNPKHGESRLAQIDLATREPRTVFPVEGTKLPSYEFFTRWSGYLDVHRDKERVLVALSHQGAVWEVNPLTGELLWEYIYAHSDGSRRIILTAKYCYGLSFPMNTMKVQK